MCSYKFDRKITKAKNLSSKILLTEQRNHRLTFAELLRHFCWIQFSLRLALILGRFYKHPQFLRHCSSGARAKKERVQRKTKDPAESGAGWGTIKILSGAFATIASVTMRSVILIGRKQRRRARILTSGARPGNPQCCSEPKMQWKLVAKHRSGLAGFMGATIFLKRRGARRVDNALESAVDGRGTSSTSRRRP